MFAVLQLMSKQALSGVADLIEALLMTAVMSYFLKLGQYVAAVIMGDVESAGSFTNVQPFGTCGDPIGELWYLLLVPIAAVSWSACFLPSYRDLPVMTLHGILAYIFIWGIGEAKNIGALARPAPQPHSESANGARLRGAR